MEEGESWRVLWAYSPQNSVLELCTRTRGIKSCPGANLSIRVSQLLVSPARALLENLSAARNLGPALIAVLITGRGALPPLLRPVSRPPGPTSLFASKRWGSTRYSGARLQARPGERSSLLAAGRARARSLAPSSHGYWACAARGRLGWELVSGLAGGQSRLHRLRQAGRCRGALGLRGARRGARFSATGRGQRLGGSRSLGRAPAGQIGGFLLATSCLVWARGASRESRGPAGGSEVRAPRGKAPAGVRRLELSLDFKNPPLCAWVERCQAPRPPSSTLTAFNWCWESQVCASARRSWCSASRGPPGAARPAPPAAPRAPGKVGREDSQCPRNISW